MENPFAEKELVGGNLALDFANTVSTHGPDRLNDWLGGYHDLAWWSVRAGVVDDAGAHALIARSRAEAGEAARVFARAIALREAIFRAFSSLAREEAVVADDLRTINHELARALPHLRVAASGDGFGWEWEGDALDRVIWPVARAAAELLASGELGRIGECAGDDCEWLYLDTSRNHSRRWCVMADCGNRAKARRHYHRARSGADGS